MPWSESDAEKKTHKANTPKKRRQWKEIANGALERGDSDKSAIMQANGVLKKEGVGLAKAPGE
jgi:hypothetical protein